MIYQSPMLSCPLKQTTEVDWIQPLKNYIRESYGMDPETFSEECAMLNRLRQDMRGAGKESSSGRDLLYRYYGQLELLELRFPVDEHHIKISFTWYDAFTHKVTSQYSLAYEKASVIFNIAAVLSCNAADQNRHEEAALKTAYHSFQASAGMFTYINENFLHAPSNDLSRETVKTMTSVMLGQAQEVFIEKQVEDGKKPALLAKLASQAAYYFVQAVEGIQENVNKGIFDKSWLLVVQAKASYLSSFAGYYQAIADEDAGRHGAAISRWQLAREQVQTALGYAKALPSSFPSFVNLGSETGAALTDLLTRHLNNTQNKLNQANKDNDFLYHEIVPSESTLPKIVKMPAVKPIPASELYAGQDMTRIIGPDLFNKIVPMAVTEASSVYEEEKARLLRAEAEKVETANGEMDAALDYLKLPGSLAVLKGQSQEEGQADREVERHCQKIAVNGSLRALLEKLKDDRTRLLSSLDQCTTQLDAEESACEKLRVKYGAEWTQQPSSVFAATLRKEVKAYRDSIKDAAANDDALLASYKKAEQVIEEMRGAGAKNEVDVMFQEALFKMAESSGRRTSTASATTGNLLDDVDDSNAVNEQIAQLEELCKKLMLVKKDRTQVLKDLREKIHADDISQVLVLNKKNLSGQEAQIFQAELEKFRPHQTRLRQADTKQTSLLKEVTKLYGELLQDSRVRAEQQKHETMLRQRSAVVSKYEEAYKTYKEVSSVLAQAQGFYAGIEKDVDSLSKNVEEFVGNRKAEGMRILQELERKKETQSAAQDDHERQKLNALMSRLSVSSGPGSPVVGSPQPAAPVLPPKPPAKPSTTPYAPPMTATYAQPTTAQQPLNYLGQMTSSIPSTGQSVGQAPTTSAYPTPPPPPPQPYGQPGNYNPSAYAQPTTPQTPYPPTSYATAPPPATTTPYPYASMPQYPPQPPPSTAPPQRAPSYSQYGSAPPPPGPPPSHTPRSSTVAPPMPPYQAFPQTQQGYPYPGQQAQQPQYGQPPQLQAGQGQYPPPQQPQQPQQPQSQGDPWAGLSNWK